MVKRIVEQWKLIWVVLAIEIAQGKKKRLNIHLIFQQMHQASRI